MGFIGGVHTIYAVQPGDTLYGIARRAGSSVELLESINALYPPYVPQGFLLPGQVLVVSEIGIGQLNAVRYLIQPGDTLYGIGQRFSATPELMVGVNPLIQNPNQLVPGVPLTVPGLIYSIEEGETLYGISRKLGISPRELVTANRGRPGFSPDVLAAGYRLIVPLPSSTNILVLRPLPGTLIRPGQALEGLARAFEATILYRLMDQSGQLVTQERSITTSAGAPAFGFYSAAIVFDRQPSAPAGELWVYARSAKDGSIVDLVQVPVRLQPV